MFWVGRRKEKGENSGTEREALEMEENGTLTRLRLRNAYWMRDRGVQGYGILMGSSLRVKME